MGGGGLKGSTEITKYLLDNYQATADQLMGKSLALPEWDSDYVKKLIEMRNTSKLTMEMTFSGVTANVNGGDPYKNLYLLPSATSIAECYPVHQATCDTYNNKFIFN